MSVFDDSLVLEACGNAACLITCTYVCDVRECAQDQRSGAFLVVWSYSMLSASILPLVPFDHRLSHHSASTLRHRLVLPMPHRKLLLRASVFRIFAPCRTVLGFSALPLARRIMKPRRGASPCALCNIRRKSLPRTLKLSGQYYSMGKIRFELPKDVPHKDQHCKACDTCYFKLRHAINSQVRTYTRLV